MPTLLKGGYMKIEVWLMKEKNGQPFRTEVRKISEKDDFIIYKNSKDESKTYHVSLKNAFEIKGVNVIMLNIDKECQYSLFEVKQLISAHDLDMLITQKVIAQIMAKIRNSTEPFDKSKMGAFIIVGIACICIGIMIGIFAYPAMFPANVIHIAPTPTPIPSV